jgi:hypothetical protein
MSEHLVPLPGSAWRVWRYALLRTGGFPADGLDAFAAPDCAAVADAHLDGHATADKFVAAFGEATERCHEQACHIAADPLFREAVTWQNRTALHALDGLLRGTGRAHRRRERAQLVAKYWQRYCGKNETIGFFGPNCWVTIDPDGPPVTVHTGASLTARRQVFLEHWALVAYAEQLAADPRVRPWLPVGLAPHVWFDGTEIHRPTGPPLRPSRTEAAVLEACDGRPADAVAAAVAAAPASELRKEADVLLTLERLASAGLVRWGIAPAQRQTAEEELRAAVAAIPDAGARAVASAGLDRLCAARDAVAGSAGDPDALRVALDALDAAFEAESGRSPQRRAGQMYAGRALCYEDTTRDLEVTIGGAVLAAIAPPLEILLGAARWLTVAIADAYGAAFAELYADHAAATPDRVGMPLGELWFLAQGALFGRGDRPVDAVAAQFAQRWADLFGLAGVPAGTSEIRLSAAELAPAAARAFPADRPGWVAGRIHSPDLHVCASDAAALQRGEFTVVLGELHAAWATFDCSLFLWSRDDLPVLRDALRADLGAGRVLPVFPPDWPRHSGRLSHSLENETDVYLAFAPAPGTDPRRTLPISALTVHSDGGALVARSPDGRSWPLIEVFAALVAMHAVDAFKLVAATGHTPRITIDGLVVARETWRTTIGATPLATTLGPERRYLAARRWRRDLGLPERCFAKLGTETKPTYVDFTSPVYVGALGTLAHGTYERVGPDVPLVVTELLPTPSQAWVPDAAGRRYLSELRLQLVDPMTGGGP